MNHDPYLWLEDVQGERALAWVRERNAASRRVLEAHPRFASMRERFLDILNSQDRIPYVIRRGDAFYNFWQDDKNKRGLWRRTTLDEYRKPNPAWETVLDLDALAAREKTNWVWKRVTFLGPAYRRCLVSLSRGGADAVVVREFDAVDKRFVDKGFTLPEGKTQVDWIDENTLLVATDFGRGSLTESGYARVIKRWSRGQPLAQASTVFEGEAKDVTVFVSVDHTPGFERIVVGRHVDFFSTRVFLLGSDGRATEIAKPLDASLRFAREHLLLQLRSDLVLGSTSHPRGSLLVADAKAWLAGQRKPTPLFTPSPTKSLVSYTVTQTRVVLNVLDNVAGRIEEWHRNGVRWVRRDVQAPFPGTLALNAVHDPLLAHDTLAEHYSVTYVDFLTPDSLWLARTGTDRREPLKSRRALFDAAGMRVEQRFAKSKDGTRVPYFVVWPRGARADGANPTLLYGYGGFEQPLQPWYSPAFGGMWFGQGGVLVVANIRGGGEFGPAWHQAATKANKQKSFDDFIAVAQDLIATRVTSARHLGIQGGSNGGLLVGAVMLQRPELFNAVVCQVPLLDMKRYHRLLAGASWMSEYGNPDDPADWAVIAAYSPYQNVKPGVKLPKVLFTTSTRDDRVHPGHARKMAARMLEQRHELLYYENIEGGHGGAADNFQSADIMALEFSFLWQQLGS